MTSKNALNDLIARTLFETIDQVPEGFQIIDREWRYAYVNQTVAQQGKRAKELLLGRTMMECYPGIEDTSLFEKLKRCMNEAASQRFENEFTFPDGSRGWFDLYIHPVEMGIAIFSVDITAQKNTERELFTKIKEADMLMVSTVDREIKMMKLKEEMTELRRMVSAAEANESLA